MKFNFTKEAISLFDGYPLIIRNHLYKLFSSILNNLDLSNVVSVLFIGSGSRGELSYIIKDDVIDIFSDYEFVIVVHKRLSKKDFYILNKIFSSLEEDWNVKSPLFYIDYGISTLLKFKNTPPTLWAFEARNLGVIIYGRDVRKNLPDVTLSNIDYGNLNELVIIRLWNMLIHMNEGFIYNRNSDYENFIVKFFYSRNILDILTILLPNYNILIGGYKNRTKYFLEEFKSDKWIDYKNSFEKATKLKVDLIDEISIEESQKTFQNGFVNLIACISKIDNIVSVEDLESKALLIVKNKIFKEKLTRFLRRKAVEVNLFKNYYKYDFRSIELFFNDRIRISLLFLLLYMHKSIDFSLTKDRKVEFLKKAIVYYNKVSFVSKFTYENDRSFELNFINLRKKLLQFMMIWLYSRSNVNLLKIKGYMNWEENKK